MSSRISLLIRAGLQVELDDVGTPAAIRAAAEAEARAAQLQGLMQRQEQEQKRGAEAGGEEDDVLLPPACQRAIDGGWMGRCIRLNTTPWFGCSSELMHHKT